MTTARGALAIRPSGRHDDEAVLDLLQASLGWVPDDLFSAFYEWKHRGNPFGESPGWVAIDRDRIVGFRTFLRWEFVENDRVVRAVRAVDTATHPHYQGRGIFSRLTLHGLETLRSEGVAFVFNTPNAKSRPGYIKMGWQVVGRLPASARLSSASAAWRATRARVSAEKWSQPCTAGVPAHEVLADEGAVARLLGAQPPLTGALATRRSAAFLRWRYGFEPLHYRAVLRGTRVDEGFAIFRVRRRGHATEAVLCDALVPGGDRRAVAELCRAVARASGADYALRLDPRPYAGGFLRLPGQGPTLTWREVGDGHRREQAAWRLAMGDVELF